VDHVHEALLRVRAVAPARAHLLLIGSGINFVDVAGAELLVREAQAQRDRGGALYLCSLKPGVTTMLERGGYLDRLGRDNIFATKNAAIQAIYSRLDSAICRTCPARIFVECQTVLPDGSARA
jgi:SulP family sulfate permease